MHVQTKGEPFEHISSLILVYFNSLSLLIVQLCLTIYQASGRDKCFSAKSQILQDSLFCFGGVFFWLFFSPLDCDPFMSFHLSFFAFCLCHQLLPLWVFSLFLPPWCSLHHPCALSLLPKHWICISQHHQVNSHTFDQCFPPSFAHILHPKLRGKCEEIRQSREQHPETWSGKWLNNIPLKADNLRSVTKGCNVCSCFLYAHGFRSLHFLCLNGFNF